VVHNPRKRYTTEDEIIGKAGALPDRFADRLTQTALYGIKLLRGGGQYGELTIELAACLAAHHTPVTPGGTGRTARCWKRLGCPPIPLRN
jgi:hypothetical protein